MQKGKSKMCKMAGFVKKMSLFLMIVMMFGLAAPAVVRAKDKIYFADYLFNEGFIKICKEDKNGNLMYGFMNKKGKITVSCKYYSVNNFTEGLAEVTKGGKITTTENSISQELLKSGYINKKGKLIIPFKYDDAYDFSEGLAWVGLNGKLGTISR